LEALRAKILAVESEYNIAQFVWEIRRAETDHSPSAYPEIDSEFLIEDPEEDFRAYLRTLEVDEKYREETLTKIAVEALRISVRRNDESLTLESLSEGED
jgi:hypothetical protein